MSEERQGRRKSSVDKLNISQLYAYGYELLISELRRASDPGPEIGQLWVPTAFHPQLETVSDNSSSSSDSSSRSLTRRSSVTHQQQHQGSPNSCPNCLDLLKCLKKRYRGAETHTEKILLLTTVPEHLVQDDMLMEEFNCSRTLAYTAIALRRNFGPFYCCPPQFFQNMPNFVKESILEFFDRLENSGEMKGLYGGGTSTGDKCFDTKLFHKRVMYVSLSELFQEYILLYPFNRRTVTYSRFANLIPSYVVWSKPFYGNSQEETCIIHENFKLMLSSCYHFYSEGITRVLNEIVCSSASAICMMGYCERCPFPKKVGQLRGDYGIDEKVEFYTWQSMECTADSCRDMESRKPLAFLMITEPLPAFDKRLSAVIRDILRHHFIATKQTQHWQTLKRKLPLDSSLALVKMDFCEKFACVSKVGPSKSSKLISYDPNREIALHPFHVKYFDGKQEKVKERNFVVVSNDLRENATTSFLFRTELIEWMKQALPQIQSVIYWSDDNATNFKNSKNIINLLFHEEDFGIKANHEFQVEGHAAQECAEVVTNIKRLCRRACLKGEVAITDAQQMWKYCATKLAATGEIEFGFVDRKLRRIKDEEMRLEKRYQVNNGIIPGVDYFYSFRPDTTGEGGHEKNVCVRRLSASEVYQVVKVKGRHYDADDFFWHSVVSHRYAEYPVDERRLTVGNIVTFSIEGIFFVGKICGDEDALKGKLLVMMLGHAENVMAGRRIGQVNFDQGKIVEISTLDVVLVENTDSFPGSARRRSMGADGGWGGGRLLSRLGRRMLGGGSFRL